MNALLPPRSAPSPFRPVPPVARQRCPSDLPDARPGYGRRLAHDLGEQVLSVLCDEFGMARALELAELLTTFRTRGPADEARQDRAWAAMVDGFDAVDRACP